MTPKPFVPELFQEKLIHWQLSHGRHDLPWQENPSPYRVLVSEIMLQQTQVTTVIPYFERWMERFSSIQALADASEDEVMHYWQGLGYYSRARNLRKAAQFLQSEYQGEFPNAVDGLLAIPGVGRYTAGAIASFAFDTYGPIVDGNVKRLFCRFFGIEGVPGTSQVDKRLWELAEQYTPRRQNRTFAQGLLDLGATVCKPLNPQCIDCPLIEGCNAFHTKRTSDLPTPKVKKEVPVRQGEFLWFEKDGYLLLEKRAEDGIWGSLWCLPQIEPASSTLNVSLPLKGTFKHTFTHFKLEANVWQQAQAAVPSANQQFVSAEQLRTIGLPTPIRKFVEKHFVALI